jgi:hypothetical protein
MLLAATAATGAVQPCPRGANCATVSIAAPAAPVAPGDTVGVTLRVQQGQDDQQPGGIDDIAAMTVSIGIPPLQLADCSPPGNDGLNPSFFLLPAASGRSRVVVQNLTCAKRTSCLCPTAGEPRDAYINLLLVGNANASGVQPLPNGDLLVIALRVPSDAGPLPVAATLHIFSKLDDPAQFTRPPGAAWLSIADSRAVDQTVDATGMTMNIRVVDGSVALAVSSPTPAVSATPAPTAIGTSTRTPTTSPRTTPTASPTSMLAATASKTTALGTPTLTVQRTLTAGVAVSVTASITATPSGTATTAASATSTPTFPPTANHPPTATAAPTANEPPTATATATLTAQPTGTAPPTLTATATATSLPICVGDCDHSGDVNIAELIIGVDVVLGTAPASACPGIECLPGNGVDVSCLIKAVNAALNGCQS